MDTKTLLAAIIGFILGAFLVSIAATTFEKDRLKDSSSFSTEPKSIFRGES